MLNLMIAMFQYIPTTTTPVVVLHCPHNPRPCPPLSSPLYLGHLSDGHDTVQSFLQSLIVLLLWPGSKRRQEPGINRTTGGKQAVNISFEWSLVMEENNNITHQNTCHHVCVCKMYNVSLFLYITIIFEKHSIREDFKRLCRAPRIQNQIPESIIPNNILKEHHHLGVEG